MGGEARILRNSTEILPCEMGKSDSRKHRQQEATNLLRLQNELPIGRGRMFLSNLSGVANAVVAGWGVNGVTTFQAGYPLGFTNATNNIATYAFGSNTRPNITPGCNKAIGGGIFNRLGKVNGATNN